MWGVVQALRFDEFDFQVRSWVSHSGWPITRETLDPYYERAERVLQIGPRIPYANLCASFGIDPPAFDTNRLQMECSRWSPKPNFGQTYREDLKDASNISVFLHANAISVVTDQHARVVEGIEFKTLEGKNGTAQGALLRDLLRRH